MGLFGLERVINACRRLLQELIVSDSISCWPSIHSPNLRPVFNCYNCLGLIPLCGYLFFTFFCFVLPVRVVDWVRFYVPPVLFCNFFLFFFINNI